MKTYSKKKPLIAFVVTMTAGLFTLGNTNVVAGSDTEDLNVSANVANKCKLSNATAVAFGEYDPVDVNLTNPLDQTGSFQIKCTKDAPATLALGNGQNFSSPNRRMTDGSSNYLTYGLYSDAGRSTAWDSSTTVAYTGVSGPATSKTVYGRIPGGQDTAVAGSYTDIVVITVTY